MPESRFQTLQNAIQNYGAAAFENLIRCRGLAERIIEQLPAHLECGANCVRVVPPQGQFDPRKEYGELAFSFSQRQVIALEPISFGVALIVQNSEDSGSLYLRTAIAIEITGDSFDVFVAQQPVIHVPLNSDDELEPVLEAIYQEFLQTFQIQILAFNDERFETGIGFLP